MSNNTQHVIISVTDINSFMQTALVHMRLDFMYENTARADLIKEKIMSDIEDVLAPYFDKKINVEYLTDKEYNEQ
jgi:hypothetical protein